ncbi:hypothetical protein C8R43DRAFT_942381 [Mycena crocata]|nr:hypothetical protein C8R43DRAFT_942381 [Mycena crocata]
MLLAGVKCSTTGVGWRLGVGSSRIDAVELGRIDSIRISTASLCENTFTTERPAILVQTRCGLTICRRLTTCRRLTERDTGVERQVSRSGENLAVLRMRSSRRRRQSQKADSVADQDAAPTGGVRSREARQIERGDRSAWGTLERDARLVACFLAGTHRSSPGYSASLNKCQKHRQLSQCRMHFPVHDPTASATKGASRKLSVGLRARRWPRGRKIDGNVGGPRPRPHVSTIVASSSFSYSSTKCWSARDARRWGVGKSTAECAGQRGHVGDSCWASTRCLAGRRARLDGRDKEAARRPSKSASRASVEAGGRRRAIKNEARASQR